MDKLQRLKQGSMNVEEYRQQMELLFLRAGLREEERKSIARFLSGLNMEVRDKVELLPYRDLDELVQLCKEWSNNLKESLLQNLMALTLIQRRTKPMEFWGLHLQNPRKITVRP